jgi:hypothetical protein
MAESAGDVFGPLDAETGNTSQFDSVTAAGVNTFTATTGSKNNGTYGFQLTGNSSSNTAYSQLSFTTADEFYIRFYIYISSSFTMNDDFSAWDFLILRDGSTRICRLKFRTLGDPDTIVYWDFSYRSDATTTTTNFSYDEWHRVEFRYVRDAVNGGAQFWVDGDLVHDALGNDSSADYPDNFQLGNPLSTDVLDGSIYFDDILGSTSAIGPYSDASGTSIPIIFHHMKQQGFA